jgi:hypothetical protein
MQVVVVVVVVVVAAVVVVKYMHSSTHVKHYRK